MFEPLLILILAVPVCLMWTATSRFAATRMVPPPSRRRVLIRRA